MLCGAAVGLLLRTPLGWAGRHHGIDALLVVLVFATGLTISAGAVDRLSSSWTRVALVLLSGVVVLPALAWVASRFVPSGPLQEGVLVLGLAPCEIASVSTTLLAGGEAAVAAAVLVGSTGLSVLFAGVILRVEAGHAHVRVGSILVNLLLVVALPLAVGMAARRWLPGAERYERAASLTATAALVGLVALVAAQVRPSTGYLPVLGGILLFLAGSAALGAVIARGAPPADAIPVLLTVSMRDFAIAAGLAASAFGAAAAAPLGLYGVVVLVWGTAVAGLARQAGQIHPLTRLLARLHGVPSAPVKGCFASVGTRVMPRLFTAPKRPRHGPPIRSDRCSGGAPRGARRTPAAPATARPRGARNDRKQCPPARDRRREGLRAHRRRSSPRPSAPGEIFGAERLHQVGHAGSACRSRCSSR